MSVLPKYVTKENAEKVMELFADHAMELSHTKIFNIACCMLYGNFYIVKTDLNKRMCFICNVCNREMNSKKSLQEHSISGGHLRNVSRKDQDEENLQNASSYPAYSLQDRLLKATVPVLGLPMIEAYDCGNGSQYLKCLLCGCHGRVEAMYNHIIHEEHTSKFIELRVKCVGNKNLSEVYDAVKAELVKLEEMDVSDIVVIKEQEYYPFRWEKDDNKALRNNKQGNRESQPEPSYCKWFMPKLELRKEAVVPTSASGREDELAMFRNPSPPPPRPPSACNKSSGGDASIVCKDFHDFCFLLNGLTRMTAMSNMTVNDGMSYKFILDMMQLVAEYYYSLLSLQLQRCSSAEYGRKDDILSKKSYLKRLMGYVVKTLGPMCIDQYGKTDFRIATKL